VFFEVQEVERVDWTNQQYAGELYGLQFKHGGVIK
jgi:hypothetical protein